MELHWRLRNMKAWNSRGIFGIDSEITVDSDTYTYGWGAHCEGFSMGASGLRGSAPSTSMRMCWYCWQAPLQSGALTVTGQCHVFDCRWTISPRSDMSTTWLAPAPRTWLDWAQIFGILFGASDDGSGGIPAGSPQPGG